MPDYQFWNEDAKLVVPLGEYPVGEQVSDLLWPELGTWENFQINVWVREATGTDPQWVSLLETSDDNGDTWSEVPGSRATVTTIPGSGSSNAQAPPNSLVRVRTIISGSDVTVTGRAYVLVTPPLG